MNKHGHSISFVCVLWASLPSWILIYRKWSIVTRDTKEMKWRHRESVTACRLRALLYKNDYELVKMTEYGREIIHDTITGLLSWLLFYFLVCNGSYLTKDLTSSCFKVILYVEPVRSHDTDLTRVLRRVMRVSRAQTDGNFKKDWKI